MSGQAQLRTYRRSESVVFLKTNEDFGGLSNMAGGYPIHVNGIRVLTSEALYQACRFPHLPEVQRMIIGQISPMTAKMKSKPYRNDSRGDWDQVRVRVMRWCLRMKLASNWHAFSELLLRTKDRPIVEESRKDDFWGAKATGDGSTLVGMNVLGRLLMELREQVKEQGRDAAYDIAPPHLPDFLLFGRPIEVAPGVVPSIEAPSHDQGALFSTEIIDGTEPSTLETSVPVNQCAYEAYRTARMRWLPPIPEHWNEQRAKTFFREVDERSKTGREELLSVSHITGVTPRSQKNVTMFKAASYVGSKLCQPGDIVINTLWAWMAALGASRHVGIVSPAYGVYRPRRADTFNPAYLDYLLRTRAYVAEYIGRSTGIQSSRLRLYPNQFLDIALIQPPSTEQDQIVAYLRAQDAHIARFIKAKRDLIKLLTEQKLRIIDQAVTRGLDASVVLKPSGIEWLGEVPAHWEVQRLKNVANVVLGKMLTTEAKAGDGDFKPYLRSTNVQWIKPDVRDVKEMWVAKAEMEQLRVRKGDLLVSEGGEVGRACMWNDELPECYIQNSVHRVAAKRMMLPEFLFHQFFAYGKRGRFNAIVNRVSIAHLTREKLVTIPFTVPPVGEQRAICRWITDECQPLDDAIARTEEEIKLIREYRDRLIADVVTGQVDVRSWQPGPEDVVDDIALAALGDGQEGVTEEEDGDGED